MIYTERLLLRPWQTKDRIPFAKLNGDPRVMEFFPSTLSEKESNELIERFNQHIETYGWGFWALEHLKTGELLGLTGISHVNFTAHFTPAIEVGWRLACPYWGKGYAFEAALKSLEYGFDTLKLDEIISFTSKLNLRSISLMKRLGMRHDPKDDFDHPKLPEDHPLRPHVLFRGNSKTLRRVKSPF